MPRFWTVLSGRLAGRGMTDLDDLARAQPALALLARRLTIWQRRDDLLGGLARLGVGSLPFGCWVRFVVISGRDRTLALAGQTFTVMIPLLIVAAAYAPDDQALPNYMIDRYGLTGTAAEAVTLLFSRPPVETGTITVLGLVLLFYSLVSLTRAMQRLWEVSWEMEPTGVRGTIDALSGFGLFLAQIIVLTLMGAFLRGSPLGGLLVVPLRIAVAVVLWQQLQYLLLSRRVPRMELLPGAVVGGVGQVVASAFSVVWMPHLLNVNAQRYGVIGVTFALLSWLIILSACIVASAVISGEWALRRRLIVASEAREKAVAG
jgi:membrane protein